MKTRLHMPTEPTVTVVDLFAGSGGLSLGFRHAGYSVLAAYDDWMPAVKTYKANILGHDMIQADLREENVWHQIAELKANVIIGGPPCQDFSSAGNRDESGGRADLTVVFANIVSNAKPQYFIMENVARAQHSKAVARAREIFQNAGYGLSERIVDASYCGVPQKRKRFIMAGALAMQDCWLDEFLDQGLSSVPTTMREYFGDELGISHYYRHPRSYKRRAIFSIDEPSPTIRGVNRPVPPGYTLHDGDPVSTLSDVRPLTSRERAMVQTFPRDFEFLGTKTEIEQMIGNAVPVKFAEYVAKSLMQFILTRNRLVLKRSKISRSDQVVLEA